MLLDLEWTGQDAFVREPLKEWTVDGAAAAGLTRSAGKLTFATVYGAGHMVSPMWCRSQEIGQRLSDCLPHDRCPTTSRLNHSS